MTKVRELSIDGRKFVVDLDESGDFTTLCGGERIKAPSLKGLTEKLRKHVRSEGRIAIPVSKIDQHYGRGNNRDKYVVSQVLLTGIHARSGNVLYKNEATGEADQSGYSERFYKRLTAEEIAKFQALVKAERDAVAALGAWQDLHMINAKHLIEEAQARVEDQPADPVEASK